MPQRRPVRIANCSGFYGDRIDAAREMMAGPIDVLTGDYLAELTMLILWKARRKDPGLGYATTFLRQMEDVLGTCLERGVKITANAGGLNPEGLTAKVTELAARLGLPARIAYITGDDLAPSIGDLRAAGHEFTNLDTGLPLAKADLTRRPVVTANAYLGGWGIAAALEAGADVVICPRVTDASLVTGPAAWWHGWRRDDWDALAGAVAAGHVIECGPQATGGNYSFLDEITDRRYPGFPIAEVAADGPWSRRRCTCPTEARWPFGIMLIFPGSGPCLPPTPASAPSSPARRKTSRSGGCAGRARATRAATPTWACGPSAPARTRGCAGT
jgi:hypothetical protein